MLLNHSSRRWFHQEMIMITTRRLTFIMAPGKRRTTRSSLFISQKMRITARRRFRTRIIRTLWQITIALKTLEGRIYFENPINLPNTQVSKTEGRSTSPSSQVPHLSMRSSKNRQHSLKYQMKNNNMRTKTIKQKKNKDRIYNSLSIFSEIN
jgi:hypothetical protein